MLNTFMAVLQDESGATLVDYGIAVLLLSITAAAVFDTFGAYIDTLLSLTTAD